MDVYNNRGLCWTPILLLLMAVLALTGCTIGAKPTTGAVAPTVTVSQPVSGAVFPLNQPVNVDSTSTSPNGIQRVELWADNVLVRVDVNPASNSPYVVSQPWTSDKPGSHVIQVKAFDNSNTVAQSQPVVIALQESSQAAGPTSPAAATETAVSTPTLGLADTLVSTPTSPAEPATPTSQPPPAAATEAPPPVCTAPACQVGEVYSCTGDCPGGCGTTCATPTLGPPTPTPPNYQPTGIDPHPALKTVWEKPGVKAYLGYATESGPDQRHFARQYFEGGYMYWWERPNQPGYIWVVNVADPSATQGFSWSGPYLDTWDGKDAYSCDAARHTSFGPVSGFGKLWCDKPEIAAAIGAPREPESGTGDSTDYGIVQTFQGGTMLYSPLDHQVWILYVGGTWQRFGL